MFILGGSGSVSDMYFNSAKVDKAYLGTTLVYSQEEPGPVEVPGYLVISSDDYTTIRLARRFSGHTIEYSTDRVNWSPFTGTTDWNYVEISPNQKIYFRGKLTSAPGRSTGTRFRITSQLDVHVSLSGNLNGLFDYENLDAPLLNYCCAGMFSGNTCITDASGLVMSADTLADYCYYDMFKGCTGLTAAPELPATGIKQYCYNEMFSGCTSLLTAPDLPATDLSNRTGHRQCYSKMFAGCTSLTKAMKELPAPKVQDSCYNNMFANCTSLTKSPVIKATSGGSQCMAGMFSGCSSLSEITCLLTGSTSVCNNWVSGVAASGTFYKHPDATGWTVGNSGVPTGWSLQDYDESNVPETVRFIASGNSVTIGMAQRNTTVRPILQATKDGETWFDMTTASTFNLADGESLFVRGQMMANGSYYGSDNDVFGITGSCVVKGLLSYLSTYSGGTDSGRRAAYAYLFSGCTGIVDAHELTLPNWCSQSSYAYMFFNCTNLVSVPSLLVTSLANYCYRGIFRGCTSLTAGPELPATIMASNCYSEMFDGCTSLVNAPVLPATTLAESCYLMMFANCTSLITAPELPALTMATECYKNMFAGCTNLVNAPALYAPSISGKTSCYSYMFENCRSLNNIVCLAKDATMAQTYNWVDRVASSGSFVKDPSATWDTGLHGIPSGWVIEEYVPVTGLNFADTSGTPTIYNTEFAQNEVYSYELDFQSQYGIDSEDVYILGGAGNSTYGDTTRNYFILDGAWIEALYGPSDATHASIVNTYTTATALLGERIVAKLEWTSESVCRLKVTQVSTGDIYYGGDIIGVTPSSIANTKNFWIASSAFASNPEGVRAPFIFYELKIYDTTDTLVADYKPFKTSVSNRPFIINTLNNKVLFSLSGGNLPLIVT